MAITWSRTHWGPHAHAYDERNRLVGTVSRYDVAPAGRCEILGHEYRAFLRGQPVNGPMPSLEDAMALLERAVR